MCFDFHVVQTFEIKEQQPAFVRVYDYYEGQGKGHLLLNVSFYFHYFRYVNGLMSDIWYC